LNNLILFGFKGCGKTYFGKRVATFLCIPFIDTDQLIEEAYFSQFNIPLSCTQIGLEKGNTYFRQLEKECIHSLGNVKNSLLSLGGGSILDPENVLFLRKLGMLLYLKMDKEVLKKRIAHELPFFIDPNDPEKSFENMYHDRKKKYEDIGAKTIDLQNKTDQQILEEISKIYGK
jgi:shikimate kinase